MGLLEAQVRLLVMVIPRFIQLMPVE
jgi:hypothetical protein